MFNLFKKKENRKQLDPEIETIVKTQKKAISDLEKSIKELEKLIDKNQNRGLIE